MQWTPRDVDLLTWINGHGFVEARQVQQKYFKQQRMERVYACLRRLVRHNMLIHEKIFFGRPGIYRLSKAGARQLGDSLPPLRQVRLAQYQHDLLLVDLELSLSQQLSGQWLPERRLRQQNGQLAIGSKGHVADGIWIGPEGSIALEVELTRKSRQRRRAICHWYLRQFEYQQVWYFVAKALRREFERLVEQEQFTFIKVFDLEMIHDDCPIVS